MSLASPKKSPKKTVRKTVTTSADGTVTHTQIIGSVEYERTYKLTDVEVENESLRTQLIGLNCRVQVVEDLHKDVATLRGQLSRSEEVREEQIKHINLLVQENASLKKENAQLFNEKHTLQIEMVSASDWILKLEQSVHTANLNSLSILKELKNAEMEIETLKAYIIDLKSRIAVYIPIKGDLIDRKLAEYINNFPDRSKLKIMFMRESSGVYEFGQRKVMVKVEGGKIQVRVGGGYLSIDEFIDQYTPVELEKLERRDPLKRFSEKVAVQKLLVGKERVETSPIRQSRSPVKGGRPNTAV